jgi:heavy metal translocating P-type ATPase
MPTEWSVFSLWGRTAPVRGAEARESRRGTVISLIGSRDARIALLAVLGIVGHFSLRYASSAAALWVDLPLLIVLAAGGIPLLVHLIGRGSRGEFGADHLAGISIVASALLHEYLAGAIVVLMLSGGNTLEQFAVAEATAVLRALAKRLPTLAHRRRGTVVEDVPVSEIAVGDEISLLAHEICPIDGVVLQGRGTMDESYLTGEPFNISKGPGASVLSGAINGQSSLAIRASRIAADSRYAQIMRVMQDAEQRRPYLRRVGDELGAWYTPVALIIAAGAWYWSGNPIRFLSVVVIATPCPLLIAIPVAIIGAISTAARRGIIVKDPAALEQLTLCRTMILDKTGTLTYGRPALSDEVYAPAWARERVLPLVAAMERYSRHPLASAFVRAARDAKYSLPEVEWIREEPGVGLRARVGAAEILITNRAHADRFEVPPSQSTGLECVVIIDDRFAALFRFHDVPRGDSRGFVGHLGPTHGFTRVLLVSGDREAEVRRLADAVGIGEVHAETPPERKLEIVRQETARARTLFIGDGINDAPALMAATVGVAFGQHSDVTSEAARVVIVDTSLSKVDEVLHISFRLRRVALESAVGGMLLSAVGMMFAAAGVLSPVAGAVAQEAIDLAAVLNALRTARQPSLGTDFDAVRQTPRPGSAFKLGMAWVLMWAALALHVADEALTGFLSVYNPTVLALRTRLGFWPMPTFEFREWLAALVAAIVLLAALTPYAFRNARWIRPILFFCAVVTGIVNALGHTTATILGHTVSTVRFERPAPGFYSSPLLLIVSLYALMQLRRTRRRPTLIHASALDTLAFIESRDETTGGESIMPRTATASHESPACPVHTDECTSGAR